MSNSGARSNYAEPTFYWYDYETFGIDPKSDRPAQFAGRRTGLDFAPVIGDEGEAFYCQPALDCLPSPESCLLTGITPQLCEEKGLKEAEFAQSVWERLNTPGTISIGYNTLGFDDEVNRFLFWRNFFDPYTHGYSNGCSRWDLFPVVCAVWALRGDTIVWPQWENIDPNVYKKAAGRKGVCFKLEFLTKANGIKHGHAHDALSDVEATIGLAKLIAEKEPRLWKWAFENRTTQKVQSAIADMKPVIWVTPRYGIAHGCTGVVACIHQEKNECWMWDLTCDPSELKALSSEELKSRLYVSRADRERGVKPLPVQKMKANASPFVCADLRVLSSQRAARYGIDMAVVRENHAKLLEIAPIVNSAFAEALQDRYEAAPGQDPDLALYSSGFTSRNDKVLFEKIHHMTPDQLATDGQGFRFDNPLFSELLLRYRARNWPETLNEKEREYWRKFCEQRLLIGEDGVMTINDFFEEVDRAQTSGNYTTEENEAVFEALYEWAEHLGSSVSD